MFEYANSRPYPLVRDPGFFVHKRNLHFLILSFSPTDLTDDVFAPVRDESRKTGPKCRVGQHIHTGRVEFGLLVNYAHAKIHEHHDGQDYQ